MRGKGRGGGGLGGGGDACKDEVVVIVGKGCNVDERGVGVDERVGEGNVVKGGGITESVKVIFNKGDVVG